MIIRRRSPTLALALILLFMDIAGSRPDVLEHQFIDLQHQLVGTTERIPVYSGKSHKIGEVRQRRARTYHGLDGAGAGAPSITITSAATTTS